MCHRLSSTGFRRSPQRLEVLIHCPHSAMISNLSLDVLSLILNFIKASDICRLWLTCPSMSHAVERTPLQLSLSASSWSPAHQCWLSHLHGLKSASIHFVDGAFGDTLPTAVLFKLPRGMDRLLLRCQLDLANLLFLPPQLVDLRIPSVTFREENVIQDLPASLTVLGVGFYRLTPKICAALPRALTRLDIWSTQKKTKDGSYSLLPPNLLRLTCQFSSHLGTFEEGDLPPYLTNLYLLGNTKITDKGMALLPKSITSIKIEGDAMTGVVFSEMKSLRAVHISSSSYARDTMANLPISVTSVSFGYPPLREHHFKQMPPRLLKLACEGNQIELINAIQYLPASITLLSINHKTIHVRLKK